MSPNIGLQRTSACGLAAEAGSLGRRFTVLASIFAGSLLLPACSLNRVTVARVEVSWPPASISAQLGLPSQTKSGNEIRVWLGGGVVRPYDLYRICESGEGISGEHIAWTEVDHEDSMHTVEEARQRNADMHDFLKDSVCRGEITTTPDWMFCRAKIESTVEWRIVAQDLMPEQLWKLPEKLSRDCGMITADGEVVTIEVLSTARHHVVQYDNPDFCCAEIPCAIANHVRRVVQGIQ